MSPAVAGWSLVSCWAFRGERAQLQESESGDVRAVLYRAFVRDRGVPVYFDSLKDGAEYLAGRGYREFAPIVAKVV